LSPELERHFFAAADLDAAGQRAYLDEHCAASPELRRQVEALLAHDQAGADFLSAPVQAVARGVEAARAPDVAVPRSSAGRLWMASAFVLVLVLGLGGWFWWRSFEARELLALSERQFAGVEGDWAAAWGSVERAAAVLGEDDADVQLRRSELLLAQGRFAESLAAARRGGENRRAWLVLGRALLQMGRTREAIPVLGRVPGGTIELARALPSDSLARRLMALSPTTEGYWLLAELEPLRAREHLAEAARVARDPYEANETRVRRGAAELAGGDLEAARRTLEPAVAQALRLAAEQPGLLVLREHAARAQEEWARYVEKANPAGAGVAWERARALSEAVRR